MRLSARMVLKRAAATVSTPVAVQQRFNDHVETLASLAPGATLGLCVSGGPDSMALLQLAHHWATSTRTPLMVAHVNHGLRATAADEAQWLRAIVERKGIPFVQRVLQWGPNERASHASLRAKRYASLLEMANEFDCRVLATAHHRDDVLETFVQRVHMASGLAGLARPIPAKSFLWPGSPICVIRPLLELPKSALIATLEDPMQCIDDPLNAHPKYLRARVRAVLESDLALKADISDLCGFIGQQWAAVETTAKSLVTLHVQSKEEMSSIVAVGLISVRAHGIVSFFVLDISDGHSSLRYFAGSLHTITWRRV